MFKIYKRIECIIIIFVMVLSLTTDFSLKQTNAATVYYIYTVEDLYDVRNHLDATFYLMNDLDISKETSNGGLYDDEGRGWKPIGDASKAFTGVFYGQGHTIEYNIKINSSSPSFVGLFGRIGVPAIIQDLKVEGNISGTAYGGRIGGIVGSASLGRQSKSLLQEGLVKNCISNVKIDVSNNSQSLGISVGGIIGYMEDSYWYLSGYTFNTIGKVDECVNAGEIKVVNNSSNSSTASKVGGVVGYIDTIKNSSDTFSVSQSYNEGSISLEDKISGDSCVSGICGKCSTTVNVGINNCYNTGYISNKCSGTCSSISKGGKCSYCYNVGGRYSSTKYWSIGDNNENNNCYSLQGVEVGNTSPGTTYLNEQQMTMKSMILFNYNVWLIDLTCVYKYPQLKNNRQYNNKEITLVELIQRPDKLKYYKGDDINLDNGVVKVYYVDGSTQTMDMTYDMLNKTDVDGYTASLGNKSVYIYPDLDENPSMNTRYVINVINKPTATNLQLLWWKK